jgi:hypothetical protein
MACSPALSRVRRKISAKAEQTLAGIDREMTIMKWPDEYRALWEAIADAASIRAREARHSVSNGDRRDS